MTRAEDMLVDRRLLMVAPNPCTEYVHVKAEELVRNVVICDKTGAIIKVETVNEKSKFIDIGYLTPGSYILKIQNYDGEWSSQKITKL